MAVTVGDLLVRLRGDATDFNAKMLSVSKRMQAMGSKMSALGGKIAIGIGVPLGLIGVKAAKAAMEVETNFAHIRGLVGATQATIDSFADAMGRVGKVSGKSGAELSKASFFITSAGLKGERAAAGVRALEASAMGAAAGLGDTAIVADAATSAMNAYGEANLSAEMAVATLVGTVREGKAEASSIAPVLGRLLPVAAELGVGFDQVGAALAAMTRLGFDAATSATSIRATMVAMLKPASQAEKALSEYGLSFSDLRAELKEKGLMAVLTKLKDVFGENETAMARVFPNVRALAGILSLVGQNAEASEQVFASLAKTTEQDLLDAFTAVEVTAKHRLNQAMVQINSAFRKLGEDILPVVIPMIQSVANAVEAIGNKFQSLNPMIQQAIIIFGAVAMLLGPILVIFGALVSSVGALLPLVGQLTALFAAQTPVINANSAAMTVNARASQAAARSALAMKAGLVALVGFVAYKLTTMFMDATGATHALREAFGLAADKAHDLTEGLQGSQTAFQDQLQAYDQLRKRLGLTNDQWRVQGDFTKENAARLSRLTEEVIKHARAQEKVLEVTKQQLTAEQKAEALKNRMAELMKKANADEAERVKLLKEEYDLQTRDDILDNLEQMVEEYHALKRAGVDNVQLAEEFGGKLKDQAELAKRNGIVLSSSVTQMADALKDDVDPALKKTMEEISTQVPKHVNVMGGKVIKGMATVGGKVAESLDGGFQKGFESAGEKSDILKAALKSQVENGVKEGVILGEKELGDMRGRQEAETLVVPVVGDWTAFDEQAKYRSTGYTPPTGEAGQP